MLGRTEAIAHVGSWEWDVAEDAVTWSDELYRIFGREPSTEPPNWAEHDVLYTPESMAKLRSAVEQTLEDGTPYELELQAVRANGEIRQCLCRGHAEMGPEGKPVRLFGSLQDITELRIAERDLRQSEQRFRSFVENANDILYAVAPDGIFTYISPNWLEFMGEPAERAVGRSFTEYVHPEDVHLCREFLETVLATGEKQSSVEYRVYRADGVMRWHVSNGSPMRDEQGRAIGYMGIARDVTEQKQRRDAFARFCDMSTDLICLADINTATFLQVNPAATDILGYSEEELLSQPFTNFIHPDDLEATHRVIEEQLLKGQNLVSFENRYFRKDGEIRWLQWNSHPLPEEGLTYAIAYDVTERKQAEQERRNLESQLLQAQKMEAVGRLAGGVAHDFNNKLQTILGYSDILLHEENLPRSLQECVEEIHEAAVRSADLTRQLLAFARKQTISPRVLNLNETVPEMLRMLKPLISEEIDLQWYPGENVGTIRMDPAQLDQILANLVVNARDAIKQTGTITVETQNVEVDPEYVKTHPYVRPGRHVQLAVSDDGAGMDADTLDQIFEPFFTTKPSDQGTGLGLATVYGIAKQNGGFVNVYSEPGTGTTFRIYLPLTDEDTPVPPTHDRPDAAHTGSETILLVEDDPSVLRLGQKTLEELGYTVLAADRPDKALDMVDRQSAPIDLLVTDVVMPEMNGKDLLARLSKNRPGLRALFMSGYTANVIAHRGVLDEGIEFLQKPFRAVDFAARVRQVLGNSNPSD
jgi:PAS domain S-box-containing protein